MNADQELTPLETRLRLFEQRLEASPDDISTLSAYGETSLLRGRLHQAMKCYQRLMALQPDMLEHRLSLGRVYIDSGLFREAWGLLGPVLQTAPTLVEGHLLLRRLSNVNGSLAAELSQPLADSARFLPDRDAVAAQRARLESDLGHLDAEIESLLSLAAASAGDPTFEFSSCLARERQDRLREALTEIEKWERSHQALDEERLRLEEAERIRFEEEERRRREAEEAAQREEAERNRLEEEERLRREAEESAQREEAELARRQAEEDERRRQEAEEAQRGTRAREEAYATLSGQLAPVVMALMKTKGVSAALVMARDGFLVTETHTQDIDVPVFSTFVVDALHALASPGDEMGRWKTWVLEFGKGILVLHRITDDYLLVIHGQTGANFGLLTLFIDKNRGRLESILAGAPAVP